MAGYHETLKIKRSLGQGAIEYIVLLAVLSALLVFGAPFVNKILFAIGDVFAFASKRVIHGSVAESNDADTGVTNGPQPVPGTGNPEVPF